MTFPLLVFLIAPVNVTVAVLLVLSEVAVLWIVP